MIIKKINNYLLIVFILSLNSCKSQKDQHDCINATIENKELIPLFTEIRDGLKDTLKNWIYVEKYENVQGFLNDNWKIDEAVFINSKKDNAILLVLEQDTTKYISVPSDDGVSEKIIPTTLDYIKLIYANKEVGYWHYYYQTLPLYTARREEIVNGLSIPVTFEKLSFIGRRNVLYDYYKKGTCNVNDKFFKRWDVDKLKKYHEKIDGYYK